MVGVCLDAEREFGRKQKLVSLTGLGKNSRGSDCKRGNIRGAICELSVGSRAGLAAEAELGGFRRTFRGTIRRRGASEALAEPSVSNSWNVTRWLASVYPDSHGRSQCRRGRRMPTLDVER
jgi:hypothetical protein